MYPYNSSSDPNRSQNYPPTPQQRQPDSNGFYHFTPGSGSNPLPPSSTPPPKKKGNRNFARKLVALLGVVVVSAAAGGGAATYVLSQQPTAENAGGDGGTVLQTAVADKVSAVTGSVASVADIASNSVVEIDTQTQQQSYFLGVSLVEGAGSGVIISPDGYIVTNNHVVVNTESIVVRLKDGTEYNAELIGMDSQTDLAVLKIDASDLDAVTFADSDQIQVGDLAVAIGNPLGELGGTVTSGIVSATGRDINIGGEAMTLLQTSAAINPGNSGGGLFDSNGHLIGVVNAKSAGVEVEGLGFAIPSNTVQEVASDLIDKGYVAGRTQMGIQIIDVQDSMTAMRLGVSKSGVYVADPGENEGLQVGDRFAFADEQDISSAADLNTVLREHSVGDTIDVTVEREGKAVHTQVTLREKIPENLSSSSESQAAS